MERKLWSKDDPYPEGYLLANGGALCEMHHRHPEADFFPPQALRRWLDLPIVLPRQLDTGCIWDKWGMEIPRLADVARVRVPCLTISPRSEKENETVDIKILLGKPLVVTAIANASLAESVILAGYEPDTELFWLDPNHAEYVNAFGTDWELAVELWKRFEAALADGFAGIVIRNAYPFHAGNLGDHVGKIVQCSSSHSGTCVT